MSEALGQLRKSGNIYEKGSKDTRGLPQWQLEAEREGSLRPSKAALDAYGWKTELGPYSIQLMESTEQLASPYS